MDPKYVEEKKDEIAKEVGISGWCGAAATFTPQS
jgi:hypothetical protein